MFIVNSIRPNALSLHGLPHVQFPAYSQDEILEIISSDAYHPPGVDAYDCRQVWTFFTNVVWNSLARHSARNIRTFYSLCIQLWPEFIRPLEDGSVAAKNHSGLLIANRSLLQSNRYLVPQLISERTNQNMHYLEEDTGAQLPYFSRLLLVAAYLASYNPARTDQLYFMKEGAVRRKKKGGGTAKSRKISSRSRKISRKLLGPQAFVLERMLSIFHAIRNDVDQGVNASAKVLPGSADIQMAISTLTSLRFLIKMGSFTSTDTMEGGSKWRVGVGWEVVRSVGRTVDFEVEDYIAE